MLFPWQGLAHNWCQILQSSSYKICCHGNFIYKGKMKKINNKILFDAVPLARTCSQLVLDAPKQ